MANRAMHAKVVKSKAQAGDLARHEMGKNCYLSAPTKDAQRALLRAVGVPEGIRVAATPQKTPVAPLKTDFWRPLRREKIGTEMVRGGIARGCMV